MMDRMDIINFYHMLGNKHPQTSCGWIHGIGLKEILQENPSNLMVKTLVSGQKKQLEQNQSNDGIVLMDKRQYQ